MFMIDAQFYEYIDCSSPLYQLMFTFDFLQPSVELTIFYIIIWIAVA